MYNLWGKLLTVILSRRQSVFIGYVTVFFGCIFLFVVFNIPTIVLIIFYLFQKYNVSTIEDVPHRTSISRALESVYNDCTVWLIDYIKSDCPNMVALTFDIWSDRYRRRSYLTITLHFVDKNFILKNLTLATRYFRDRHTGENILSCVENVIDCYGLTSKTIYMVTDGGNSFFFYILNLN